MGVFPGLRKTVVSREALFDVAFADLNHGMAVGWNGTLLLTSDGGEYWRLEETATRTVLYGVSQVDSLHAAVVGGYGLTLITTDGGETWANHSIKSSMDL